MVTGRIVEYDPAARTYSLPKEHAASLTRAAGPDNLAELAQIVALLGQVETPIVDVFRTGGEGLGACWGEEKARELLAREIRSTRTTSADLN